MNAIDRFLQYARHELNRSELTVDAYRVDLRQFADYVAPGGEASALSRVDAGDVRAWIAGLAGDGDSARTVRRKVQAVRALYRYLVKHGLAEVDPSRDITLAKLPSHLPQRVRQDTMDSVLDAEVDLGDYDAVLVRMILLMLYSTGMRRAELITLRDDAVDNVARQLRVTGKRDKQRIIPYGAELSTWIDRYRTLRDATAGVGHERFFVTRRGGALYPALVYRVVRGELDNTGTAGRHSPHVLRHSFASEMLGDGARLDSVKQLLGHSSLAATQVYTHVTLRELQHNYKLAHPRAAKKGE